jgi:hypothetical protein
VDYYTNIYITPKVRKFILIHVNACTNQIPFGDNIFLTSYLKVTRRDWLFIYITETLKKPQNILSVSHGIPQIRYAFEKQY